MKSFVKWLWEDSQSRPKFFSSWGLDDATKAAVQDFRDKFLLNKRAGVRKEYGQLPEHPFHITCMYDKEPSRRAQHPNNLMVGTLHSAPASHVEWWPGHDNTGYVVLRLTNTPTLQSFHDAHIESGFRTNFWPYKPHVTLLNPANKPTDPLLKDMNHFLKATNFKINMHYQGQH